QNGFDPVLYKLVGDSAEMVSTTRIYVNNTSTYPVVRALDDRLLFMHHEPATGLELYATDGTSGGTGMVKDIHPGGWDGMGELAYMYRVDDAVYFAGNSPAGGRELWRTDGTENGTVQVADIAAGSADSNPKMFTPMGDHLYFHASGYTHAQQLYRLQSTTSTAVEPLRMNEPASVFPNPNNGNFQVRVPGTPASTFTLYDALGRSVPLVREGAAREGVWTLRSAGTSAGPHVLHITGGDGRRSTVPVMIE
ncbi:MAG TPA: T9SS type A sorting domain-containing protein, partial [Flavobacteriales bacterium]